MNVEAFKMSNPGGGRLTCKRIYRRQRANQEFVHSYSLPEALAGWKR